MNQMQRQNNINSTYLSDHELEDWPAENFYSLDANSLPAIEKETIVAIEDFNGNNKAEERTPATSNNHRIKMTISDKIRSINRNQLPTNTNKISSIKPLTLTSMRKSRLSLSAKMPSTSIPKDSQIMMSRMTVHESFSPQSHSDSHTPVSSNAETPKSMNLINEDEEFQRLITNVETDETVNIQEQNTRVIDDDLIPNTTIPDSGIEKSNTQELYTGTTCELTTEEVYELLSTPEPVDEHANTQKPSTEVTNHDVYELFSGSETHESIDEHDNNHEPSTEAINEIITGDIPEFPAIATHETPTETPTETTNSQKRKRELPFWYNKFKRFKSSETTIIKVNTQPPPTKPIEPVDTTRRNSKGISLAWIKALNRISNANIVEAQNTTNTENTTPDRKRPNDLSAEQIEPPRKKLMLSANPQESSINTVHASTSTEANSSSSSNQPVKPRRVLPSCYKPRTSQTTSTTQAAPSSQVGDVASNSLSTSNSQNSQNISNQSNSHIGPSNTSSSQSTQRSTQRVPNRNSLTSEQKSIHDLIVHHKKNVFFSGAAGTGKSVLLRAIIQSLQSKYGASKVALTASTGIAAINIGGITISSFAGVGLGDDSLNNYVKKINSNKQRKTDWINTSVLVIDEISMIDGRLLDLVESVARHVRKSNQPFGGIQVIFCGDFYQLPPVKSEKLAFQAKCWDKVVEEYRLLTTPFRQKDMRFVNMLNELRVGKVSLETARVFAALMRTPKIENDIEPTELYSRKNQVHAANLKKLKLLKGSSQNFRSSDSGDKNFLRQCMAVEELCLKVGSQVMLIKNLSQSDGLVNGSLGIITGFKKDGMNVFPVVKFTNGVERIIKSQYWDFSINGKLVASRRQIPLILAWAMSIHKAQGKTIEYVKVDLNQVFEVGQAYTALSRATELDKLQVIGFDKSLVRIDDRVKSFYYTKFKN